MNFINSFLFKKRNTELITARIAKKRLQALVCNRCKNKEIIYCNISKIKKDIIQILNKYIYIHPKSISFSFKEKDQFSIEFIIYILKNQNISK